MLAARLRELVDAGAIDRHDGEEGPEYRLTPAGEELASVVRELGTWGQRWLARDLRASELDARPLIWDIHRRGGRGRPPEPPPLVCIQLTPRPGAGPPHYPPLPRREGAGGAGHPGVSCGLPPRTPRPPP